ncbi:Zn-ribbon domain-containing OB-fold protein [Caulobacter sp. 602-1]|uniref:Zn-ribbon domain-containing OB-fold protein n=1 Tax=Caulobacter sp. 602-1 TaxID=2492472 RepID=UPI000F63753C|nr:zinc ribbon domain-containing protein [Caulobacter sp. 602-1]RRN64267.1 hypothetical protein EIK80_09360 [Caulobacter sp. 602-1]
MSNVAEKPSALRSYYEGLARNVFLATLCKSCQGYTFPPTGCCEHCGSWEVEPTELSGDGTLLLATHNISPACHPRFDAIAPYVYGHIRLKEGPIVQAIVLGVQPTPDDLKALFERGPVPVKAETLRMSDLPVIAFRIAS